MPPHAVLLALLLGAAAGCPLTGPLDLGRVFSSDSIYVTGPFTPGNITQHDYYGTTFMNNEFCVGEHTGTHMDAPYHYNISGWKIAEIPLQRLIANGVFLNVSSEVNGDVNFRLQPAHIDRWIEEHGAFPENALLLVSYGWAQRYSNRTAYLGSASEDFRQYHYPGLSVAAAQRLANIDQLVGFGIDTPSIDPSGTSAAHVVLAAKNVYNLEHVNLHQPCLPARGFKVLAMPMKIELGTGAPTRVVAVPDFVYSASSH